MNRAKDYKRKGGGGGGDVEDKRVFRAHKRTLERKDSRQSKIDRLRNLQHEEPAAGEAEENIKPDINKKPKPTLKPGSLKPVIEKKEKETGKQRQERLKKWKQEKLLKKKLEAEAKSKKSFKISGGVRHNDNKLYQKNNSAIPVSKQQAIPVSKQPPVPVSKLPVSKPAAKPAEKRVKKPVQRPSPGGNKRLTRQSTKQSVNLKKPQVDKKKPKAAAAAAAAVPARTTKQSTQPKLNQIQENLSKITSKRGEPEVCSFAPTDFHFTAPDTSLFKLNTIHNTDYNNSLSEDFYQGGGSYLATPRCKLPADSDEEFAPVSFYKSPSTMKQQSGSSSAESTGEINLEISSKKLRRKSKSIRLDSINDNLTEINRVSTSTKKSDLSSCESDRDEVFKPIPVSSIKKQLHRPSVVATSGRATATGGTPATSGRATATGGTPATSGRATATGGTPVTGGCATATGGTSTDSIFNNALTATAMETDIDELPIATVTGPRKSAVEFKTPKTFPKLTKRRRRTVGGHFTPEEKALKSLSQSPMVELKRKIKPVTPGLSLGMPDLDDCGLLPNLPPQTLEEVVELTLGPAGEEIASEELPKLDLNVTLGLDEDVVNALNEGTDDKQQTERVVTMTTDKPTVTVTMTTDEHDVKYFRQLLVTETERLNAACDCWGVTMETTRDDSFTEDVKGQIRSVIGQAQLLMRQRFKQFTGLIDNCEYNNGDKITTTTDLQGFWDMIYFQVEDVDLKFKELEKLKSNSWLEEKPINKQKNKLIKKKKPIVKKSSNVKSKFAEFRAKMKKQQEKENSSAETETSENLKTFDAGFFKIDSPVKQGAVKCVVTPGLMKEDKRLVKTVLESNAR
ncbi:uncharacterized protein LOC141899196, partial [Tubulanus polymorphus]|uniref:uncharacterized protein LOC141899196 n=1 Tax=Tubulanus polymorphus TaxID=672921 RepID=UPI003DA52639